MTQKIEIIPTNIAWTPGMVNELLMCSGEAKFHKESGGELVLENQLLSEEAYSITMAGRAYFLKRIKQDFDIDPAIEYLDEEAHQGLDIELIAKGWEAAGVSYFLSPDNPLEGDSEEFIDLVVSLCKCLSGVTLMSSSYFVWCRPGIYSGDQLNDLYRKIKGVRLD